MKEYVETHAVKLDQPDEFTRHGPRGTAGDSTRELSSELTAIEGRPVPPTWRQAYGPSPPLQKNPERLA